MPCSGIGSMATSPDGRALAGAAGAVGGAARVTVFTATHLETWAARRCLPRGVPVRRVGIGLRGWRSPAAADFISCGLAGGLAEASAPGAIVIPEWVELSSGERLRCDAPLVEALVAAARALGHEPLTGPLVTTSSVVGGPARGEWASKGFVAADMETGLLLGWHPRGAAVRVILDSPWRDLSPAWERPLRALRDRSAWSQAAWLCRAAPACALRAAAVVRAALILLDNWGKTGL